MRISCRFLLIITLVLFSFQVFAQQAVHVPNKNKPRFGPKAGLNLSNVLYKDDDGTYSDNFKMNTGFHVGGVAEFPFGRVLSLETAVLLSTKGFNSSEEYESMGEPYTFSLKLCMFYLDVPVTLKAGFDIGKLRIYGAAGPYLGVGLSGKMKSVYETSQEREENEEDIEWGNADDDTFKRLEYGVTMGGGVEIRSFQIGVFYNLGLANISNYTEGGYMFANRVLAITAAYKFGGR